MSHMLILSFVLDPRYKLEFSRHCLNFMFSKEDVDTLTKSIESILE